MSAPRRVALVLGSGGARGYAHIGAIQVLEERGLEIVGIAGSSMGALVGGIKAAGKLDEFTEWALTLTQFEVLRMLDVSLTAPGAVRAEKVLGHVRDLLGDVAIEDLPMPYTAVATDLEARREVWFQRGPLDRAIRASIALPGIFTPAVVNGRVLVDGGLMDPVPVAPTAAVDADLTIAVSLGGDRAGGHEVEPVEQGALDEWVDRFRRGAAQALESEVVRTALSWRPGAEVADDDEPALPAGLTRFDVMNQSLEAMQTLVAGYRLAGFPPDIMITVPKDACRTLDFHRAQAMIAIGRTAAEEALDSAGIGG